MTSDSTITFHENIAIADTAFTVKGKDQEELFRNAAIALVSSMADISKVETKEQRILKLENPRLDMLLFDFLQELIFLKDTEGLLFSNFEIRISKKENLFMLDADCKGEFVDPVKHKVSIDIKAITLHMFEVKETKSGFEAHVVIDV